MSTNTEDLENHETHERHEREGLSRGSRRWLSLGLFLLITCSGGPLPGAEPGSPAKQPAANSNAGSAGADTGGTPRFELRAFEIHGDTLLSTPTLMAMLTKYTGPQASMKDVVSAATDLQMAYRSRGYPTVSVTIPQQQISNGIVKLRVFEGRLAEIRVANNTYFTSNNVMRALPSLETNSILNGLIFQAELDRANANHDRQIYPEIRPGPEPNTSLLYLDVKDRLPLHGRLELNNLSTPGTPELRANSSLVYNNLWQVEHSIGVQYSGSPEAMKGGGQWAPYDQPLVANYSAFYRMPLAAPDSIANRIAAQPGSFGYNEATRQFNLPPPSGQPELNVYASRATIDTGLLETSPTRIFTSDTRTIDQQDIHQDLTVNESIGFRLTDPLPQIGRVRESVSGGLDFKSYKLQSAETNLFIFTDYPTDDVGNPLPPRVSQTPSAVPASAKSLEYLPLSLRWDANWQDTLICGTNTMDFGIGCSGNFWYTGSRSNLQTIAGSKQATGQWVSLAPSLSRDQVLYKDWKMTLRADGQWASEPLISNEQFGIGGTAGVRGYQEGEVFGDTGWRVSIEPKSPPILAGQLFDRVPLYVRYSVFMDYGESYLLDPQGRTDRTKLWGTGAAVSATFGPHFEARVAAGVPLLKVADIDPGNPRFYFTLAAQF
jgi:hemolysin activation/secretion protein